jgi:hypothetical protein
LSEADLKDSLDSDTDQKETDTEEKNEIETRLDKDYQLARAIDLIKGINIYQQTLIEK